MRMLENRVLKEIFGPKRDEMVRGWWKLQSEQIHSFCSSPNINITFKSRHVGWPGHLTHLGRKEMHITYKSVSQLN
jgi:hypothetical protein